MLHQSGQNTAEVVSRLYEYRSQSALLRISININVETPTPKSFKSTQINVRAKALEATVSESGRQLQTPKVSVEFPLLAV